MDIPETTANDNNQKDVPHLAGKARCLDCRAIWVAVAPVGTTRLECQPCGTQRGVWVGAVSPPDDAYFWRCTCGNDLFSLTPAGAPLCAMCGLRATSWAEG